MDPMEEGAVSVMDMEEIEMTRMTIIPSNGYLPPSLANRCGKHI